MLCAGGQPGPQQAGSTFGLLTLAKFGSVFYGFNVYFLPTLRERPSHSASGFRRHWNNNVDHIVPMPFTRGIPMRGDALGNSVQFLDTIGG